MSLGTYPLKVTFHLDQGAGTCFDPFCPTHLDDLIFWALLPLQRTRRVLQREDTPEDIRLPLFEDTIRGYKIWRASALFIPNEDTEKPDDVRFFRKKFNTANISEARGNVNLASGTFRDHNIPVNIKHLSTLIAYTYGNRHRIEQIVRNIPAIGGKRHRGLGRVEGVTVERINDDRSLVWNGVAMRWLPDPNGLRDVRPRPPYWNVTGRVRCCEVGDPV